jgi:hypothetical protein
MKKPYILEVQKFTSGGKSEVAIQMNGIFTHIGYMDKIFLSKQEACDYYDIYNKHMRSLNAHGTWSSDWDPYSRLRYVVRKYDGEVRTISPFVS